MSRDLKIGALVLVALATLAAAVFVIGGQRNLFTRTASYSIQFATAGGLASGNPVHLSGVTVGTVEKVRLPEKVESQQLTVWIEIEARYAERIRTDSVARIKTLGLLGDKYIDVSSGTPTTEIIPDGGQIPTAPATDVDKLLASGEDVVDNVVAISSLMRGILGRMDRGEGLLGSLVTENEAKDSIIETLQSIRNMADSLERGEGTLGVLINDDQIAIQLEETVSRLGRVAASFESGEGVASQLLNDPTTRDSVDKMVGDLSRAAEKLSVLAEELEAGEGLLMRLLRDPEYGKEVGDDLRQLFENLESVSSKIDRGDGSAAALINDPAIYEAVNDMVVGVNESRFLRWLIRNRQKKGIETRYKSELEAIERSNEDPTPTELQKP